MKRDIVLYFAGGTMSGVFGAGVAMALYNNDISPRIKAVYGVSAGIMTGAYFLSKQAELGASIYLEDLSNDFIRSPLNFFIGVWQRFQNKFMKQVDAKKMRDAIDVDYLFNDIVRNRKKLDTQAIVNQEIPIYLKLLDLDTRKIEYLDIRRPDIINLLRVGVAVFPYIHKLTKIDGRRLIDAGIVDILGTNYLVNRHPNDKIILVLNRRPEWGINYKIKNMLEGKFMEWMFNDRELYSIHAQAEEQLLSDIKRARSNPNILLAAPPRNDYKLKSRTTDPKLLVEAFNSGIREGERILSLIS